MDLVNLTMFREVTSDSMSNCPRSFIPVDTLVSQGVQLGKGVLHSGGLGEGATVFEMNKSLLQIDGAAWLPLQGSEHCVPHCPSSVPVWWGTEWLLSGKRACLTLSGQEAYQQHPGTLPRIWSKPTWKVRKGIFGK